MSLNNKWIDGTLKPGEKYYCNDIASNKVDIYDCVELKNDTETWLCLNIKNLSYNNIYHKYHIEVLAKVPTYEEYERAVNKINEVQDEK